MAIMIILSPNLGIPSIRLKGTTIAARLLTAMIAPIVWTAGGQGVLISQQSTSEPAATAGVNTRDEQGRTALMLAAKRGDAIRVRALAAHADVDAQDEDGKTALVYAAGAGKADCVKLLITAGADVNADDNENMTVLMTAAQEGDLDCVKALLAAGADVNARTGGSYVIQTALEFAKGHPSIIATLKAAQKNPATARKATRFDGRITRVDAATGVISVVPWDADKKRFDMAEPRVFTLVKETIIKGSSSATVAEIEAGTKAVDEIKQIGNLLDWRVTVHWGAREVPRRVQLVLLFGGEQIAVPR